MHSLLAHAHTVLCVNAPLGLEPALDVRFAQAAAAYADAFGGDACRAVPVEHQGNTLLAAGAPLRGTGADALRAAAERETDARGLLFDAGARVRWAEEIK